MIRPIRVAVLISCLASVAASAQDRAQQKPKSDLRGHRTAVQKLEFLPDANQLVSASVDAIKLWNFVERKELRELIPRGRSGDSSAMTAGGRSIQDMSVSPDGTLVAEAVMESSQNGVVRLWNIKTGEVVRMVAENLRSVRSAQFTPDGKYLAATVRDDKGDQKVVFYETATGTAAFDLKDDRLSTSIMVISADGKLLAGAAANRIQIWDLETRKVKFNLPTYKRPVTALAFSHDGALLASAAEDEPVRVWDTQYGIVYKEIQHGQDAALAVVFSLSGQILFTGGKDSTIKIWEPKSLKLTKTLWGHRQAVTSLALNGDGKLLAAGSKDATVTVWDYNEDESLKIAEKAKKDDLSGKNDKKDKEKK